MDTDRLLTDLAVDEGFKSHAYKDSEGYWTIGFGRLIDPQLGGGIARDEGMVLLRNDVRAAIMELDRSMPWWQDMPEPARRGLCNMAFNLGLGRLLGFSKMIAALKAGDYERAAVEALDSKWARQVGARADRIAALYREA